MKYFIPAQARVYGVLRGGLYDIEHKCFVFHSANGKVEQYHFEELSFITESGEKEYYRLLEELNDNRI